MPRVSLWALQNRCDQPGLAFPGYGRMLSGAERKSDEAAVDLGQMAWINEPLREEGWPQVRCRKMPVRSSRRSSIQWLKAAWLFDSLRAQIWEMFTIALTSASTAP